MDNRAYLYLNATRELKRNGLPSTEINMGGPTIKLIVYKPTETLTLTLPRDYIIMSF